jgi:hypothetical protein
MWHLLNLLIAARKLKSEPDSDTSKQGGVSDASKSEDSESEAEPADSIAKGLLAEVSPVPYYVWYQ